MKSYWKIVLCFAIMAMICKGNPNKVYASDSNTNSDSTNEPCIVCFDDEAEDENSFNYSDIFMSGHEIPEDLRIENRYGNVDNPQVIWEPKYEWEFDLVDGPIDRNQSLSNRQINRRLENGFHGYIYGQWTCPNFTIGVNNSMGDVGCELAAVYNALTYHNISVNMSDIIYEAEQSGYLMRDGAYGTNPFKLNRLLNTMDSSNRLNIIQYKKYKDFYTVVQSSAGKNRVFIASFWNDLWDPSQGAHTVVLYYESGNNMLYALNNKTNWNVEEEILNFNQQLFDNDTFIVGYWVR